MGPFDILAEQHRELEERISALEAEEDPGEAEAQRERFQALELNLLVPLVAITDNQRGSAEQLLSKWSIPAEALNVEQVLESPSALLGSIDQIVETLQARRERYGFSYIVVWQPMEQFAPIVARLSGT